MNTSRIEDVILFAVGDRWTKVAMVIAKVAHAMGRDLPSGDEGCELISERIEFLIRSGRLEAQGNTKNWRFSVGQAIRLENKAGVESSIFHQLSLHAIVSSC
jgi:hypothetical protein